MSHFTFLVLSLKQIFVFLMYWNRIAEIYNSRSMQKRDTVVEYLNTISWKHCVVSFFQQMWPKAALRGLNADPLYQTARQSTESSIRLVHLVLPLQWIIHPCYICLCPERKRSVEWMGTPVLSPMPCTCLPLQRVTCCCEREQFAFWVLWTGEQWCFWKYSHPEITQRHCCWQ